MASPPGGAFVDYRSRVVRREVNGITLDGVVLHSRLLTDLTVGVGGAAGDEASQAVRLWRVRWKDTHEEEEVLDDDLLPLLVPHRGGGKGSGGKAAQPAVPARLVARKAAERPPPYGGSNAGAWRRSVLSRCAAVQRERVAGACAVSEHASQALSSTCPQRRSPSAPPALPPRARSPSSASAPRSRRCVAASRAPPTQLAT